MELIAPRRWMPSTYLLLAIVAGLGLHLWLPLVNLIALPWKLAGLLPIGFGVWLNLAAGQVFRDAATSTRPFQAAAVLLTDGVFGYSRNPMYLGFGLIACGTALLLGTLSPWLVLPPFLLLLDLHFIRLEERQLAAQFGPRWDAYRRSVRRWI